MGFCLCELTARHQVLRLRLWFCKIEPGIARSRQKKQRRLRELLSIYWVHIWKNWLLKCHAYPLWLFDYLQSRWRESLQHRRQLQPVENARIVSDNACFGFDCAFCPTDFTSYETSTCNEEKFDTAPPDLDKFVQIQQRLKYWFFTKPRFLSKKLGFFPGPTIFWVFEAPGI